MESLYAEVEELLALPGIGEFEIDGCVTILSMTHISGKEGQCGLGVLSPGSDAL